MARPHRRCGSLLRRPARSISPRQAPLADRNRRSGLRRRSCGRAVRRHLPLPQPARRPRPARRPGGHAQHAGLQRLRPARRADPRSPPRLLGCRALEAPHGTNYPRSRLRRRLNPSASTRSACRTTKAASPCSRSIPTRTAPQTLSLLRAADRYTLTASDLTSTTIQLNGTPLSANPDGSLPTFHAEHVKAGDQTVAPLSVTFLAIPQAHNPACR